MLHMILTATTDHSRVSVHLVLREVNEAGVESTLMTRGESVPLYELGLFGQEEEAMLKAVRQALNSYELGIVSTPQ